MTLLQIKVDDKLNKAIKKKAKMYGVPATSLIRIILVKSFIKDDNAERDNQGKGIKIDDLISVL